MDRGKRLLRGSAAKTLNFLLTIAVSFFMMPFLVRTLGDEQYGLWTLVGSFLGFYGLMDVGLSSAVVRFVSRAVGRKDDLEVRRVIATSFYLFLILGLISALITVAAVLSIGWLMPNTPNLALLRMLLLILGLNFAIDFPVRSFNAVFTSNLREDIGTGIMITKNLLCSLAIYLVVRNGAGVLGLALTSVGFSLADSATRVFLAFRVEPRTTISLKYLDRSRIRPLFDYSFPTMVGRVASVLRFRLHQLIITAIVGLSAVTHYAIGFRLIELVSNLMSQATGVVTPLFSQDEGMNDYQAIRRKFILLSRMSIYVAIFFCGLLWQYGSTFIRLWMGPGYEDSATILKIFLVPFSLNLVQAAVQPLLYGISKHPFYVWTNLAEGVVSIILSIGLGQRMGMHGVVLGTAIPMTVKLLAIQPWYACGAIGLTRRTYGWLLLKNILIASAGIGAARLFLPDMTRHGLPGLAIATAAHAVIYLPVALWFGFERSDRSRVIGVFRAAIGLKKKDGR